MNDTKTDREKVLDYICINTDRLFLLAGLVLMQYEDLLQEVDHTQLEELDRQYIEKVKSVLLTEIACETFVDSGIVRECVEEVYELFLK